MKNLITFTLLCLSLNIFASQEELFMNALELLKNHDPSERMFGVDILSNLSTEESTNAMIDILKNDPNPFARLWSAEALEERLSINNNVYKAFNDTVNNDKEESIRLFCLRAIGGLFE